MLPLVGVVAIGFLVVAGKLFFFSASEEAKVPLPVIDSQISPHAPDPQRGGFAQAGETSADPDEDREPEDSPGSVSASSDTQERQADPLGGVLDIHADPFDPSDSSDSSNVDVKKEIVVVVEPSPPRPAPIPAPIPTPSPAPTPPAPDPDPVPIQRQERPAPNPDPPFSEPAKPVWRVQVGAFSTRVAADAFLRQVTQAGYEGAVVSGKTLHRVLVQGESSREETLALATRMSRNGFPGAFIVPPKQ
jgi:cell division protein FtsN